HTAAALVVAWKPSTQGETTVHSPTIRFSHSSHTAKAAIAATASVTITTLVMLAFSAAVVPPNPKIQGEKNRKAPRIRLAPSQSRAFVQFSMTPSIEGAP